MVNIQESHLLASFPLKVYVCALTLGFQIKGLSIGGEGKVITKTVGQSNVQAAGDGAQGENDSGEDEHDQTIEDEPANADDRSDHTNGRHVAIALSTTFAGVSVAAAVSVFAVLLRP